MVHPVEEYGGVPLPLLVDNEDKEEDENEREKRFFIFLSRLSYKMRDNYIGTIMKKNIYGCF